MSKIGVPTLALILTVSLTAACSSSAPSSMSPTAATPVAIGASAGSEANAVAGVVDLSGGELQGSQAVAQWAASRGWAASADGLEVSGTDVISAVSGVCPSVVITVRGVPVTVNAATLFTAPATCASLAAGTTVTVTGLLTTTATGFSVVATRIAMGSVAPPPTAPTKASGTVVTVTGTCPVLTITLQGVATPVVTSATTIFEPAGSCALVVVGKKISATGAVNATGQWVATKVEVETEGASGPGGKKKVNGEGVIGAITGSCPTLTMVIDGHRVALTAATQFVGGTCASLRSGTQVKVDAEAQPDGRIIAEKIEIVRTPGRSISGDGTVTSVTGTCPAITMMVRGYPVRTSATTTFSGGTCASIKAGTRIDVTGTSDDTGVDATAVAIKK